MAALQPSPSEQAAQLRPLAEAELALDQFWAYLSIRWWRAWKEFTLYDGESTSAGADAAPRSGTHPGPIDNADICDSAPRPPEFASVVKLRTGLVEGVDMVVLPESAWKLLVGWYGGGPAILRRVVARGQRGDLSVDAFPLHFAVAELDPLTKTPARALAKPLQISRSARVSILRYDAARAFAKPAVDARLWRVDEPATGSTGTATLTPVRNDELALSIADLGFADFCLVLLEVRSALGIWPLGADAVVRTAGADAPRVSASVNSALATGVAASRVGAGVGAGVGSAATSVYAPGYGGSSYYSSTPGRPVQAGVTGLTNLGNTCFMNSGLQCLSHAQLLTSYFLANHHERELNTSNVLGTGGKLASVYAALLHELWSSSFTSVSPSRFKSVIGHFAPQFSGYQQQDSQELVAFLLDGLHEDLNRVTVKPPTEKLESDGSPDAVIAAESWRRHLLRNQSVIVDLFQGQFKSTVVCPEPACGRVSVTFDPYMYLQVPLPAQTETPVALVLVPANPADLPVKYVVSVNKNGLVSDALAALAELVRVPPAQLVLADYYGARVYALREGWRSIREIATTQSNVVFELAHPLPTKPKPTYASHTYNYGMYGGGYGAPAAAAAVPAVPAPAAGASPPPPPPALVEVMLRTVKPSLYAPTRKELALVGLPLMLTYARGSTTNAELHALVVRAVTARVCPTALDPDAPLPFSLVLTNKVGLQCYKCGYGLACNGCPFDASDEPATIDFDANVCLTAHFAEDAFAAHFDETRVALASAREHTSAAPADPTAARPDRLDLYSCIEAFSREETLGANDLWYCAKCADHRRARKRFEIFTLPDVLVIHLKRFQYDNQFREKLGMLVEYPIDGLDLSRFVAQPGDTPPVYDLFAVSLHSGGLGGGHYTAIARNHIDRKFYGFNDSRAYPLDGTTGVVTPEAYLLFYERRSAREAREADPAHMPPAKVPPATSLIPASAGASAVDAASAASAAAASAASAAKSSL